jgi:Mor family transcriptional regulator
MTPQKLYDEFMRGLSIVGLARKYGMTMRQVEAKLRKRMKK